MEFCQWTPLGKARSSNWEVWELVWTVWNVSSTWSYHGRILSLAALIKFDHDMTVLDYIPHSPDQLQWQTIWHIVRPPPDIHFPSHWHWKDSAPHHLSLTTSQHRQASAPASLFRVRSCTSPWTKLAWWSSFSRFPRYFSASTGRVVNQSRCWEIPLDTKKK